MNWPALLWIASQPGPVSGAEVRAQGDWVAGMLERGPEGVAALAILGFGAMVWLFIRQVRHGEKRVDEVAARNATIHEKRSDEVNTSNRDVTVVMRDVAHANQDVAKNIDRLVDQVTAQNNSVELTALRSAVDGLAAKIDLLSAKTGG